MHRVWLGVDSGDPVRKQTRHHVARVAREGTLMWIRAKLPVHALCLDWSRFGRSRPEAHAVSCVYTAMIEGTMYKVHLLWRWLVNAPSYGYRQSSPVHAPCLHSSRFWCSRREAHVVSCQRSTHGIMSDFCKGRFWPPSCGFFISSRFGS